MSDPARTRRRLINAVTLLFVGPFVALLFFVVYWKSGSVDPLDFWPVLRALVMLGTAVGVFACLGYSIGILLRGHDGS